MQLKDTVEMMTSEDFKERFKAEYYQLLNRLNSLIFININLLIFNYYMN